VDGTYIKTLYQSLPLHASHGRVAYQFTNLLGGQPRLACTMLWRGATRGAWVYRGLFDFRLDLLFAPHPVHPCFLIYSRYTGLVAEVSESYPNVRLTRGPKQSVLIRNLRLMVVAAQFPSCPGTAAGLIWNEPYVQRHSQE
jgi:hypothetical protein